MNNQDTASSPSKNNQISKEILNELEIFPTGLFILNEDIIIDANESGLLLIGKSKEEIINKNFTDFLEEKDKLKFIRIYNRIFKESESRTFEIKLKGKGVNYLHSLATVKAIKGADKYSSLSLMDFTTYKMREEFVKDSEARFEHIANTAPVMIWIADVEGLFSFVNKVWLDYSGKKVGNQLGMNWLKDVHPEEVEDLLHVYGNAFKLRKPFTCEFRLKGKNGKYEWMMINGTPRLSHENIFMGFIGSCTNINAQKEFEEKIKKVNNELVEVNAAKDKFFSIISHDLRSPLGGLMGILEILNESYDSLEEEDKLRIIKEAAIASKQTYTLTENLLEWSRIQTGKMPFEPENIELFPIIKRLESLYFQLLKNKEINFNMCIGRGVYIFADIKMTETILRNLISNAIKFTNPQGTITISADIEEKFLILKIRDTGVGINKEDLDKLFRPDISYSTKGTAKESGSGLGLILCKELVEKQGGKIWVESRIEAGTTFYVSLPVSEQQK